MSTVKTLDVVEKRIKDTNSCLKSGKIIPLTRSNTSAREAQRAVLRNWLESVHESTQLSFEQIGRRAGLDPSNLTRFVKPGSKTGIGLSTIQKISAAFGVPAPVDSGLDMKPTGFSEKELVDWTPPANNAQPASNSIDWWEVRTSLLELDGFFAGDKIAVDLNRQPRDGDIVVAQLEIDNGRDAETILRRYETPYLVCRTARREYPRPEIVDGRRVIIMGVVISLTRQVASAAA